MTNVEGLINPKHEIRNPKQNRNLNAPMNQTMAPPGKSRLEHLNFGHSILFRISDLDIRA
ncbi:MAG: hypothetical protein A2Z25_13325 [Planctomycetes bacterium RBG_16_55_9]|nr:MAG: hypothetical protein A2Z25_13325 [Planctomycetes bacterium RBG_16_55_9]